MQASRKRTIDGRKIKAVVFDAYGTLYDVQSVEGAVEAAFPGRGSLITAIWRMKQLEYSWLVTLMERYEDFWSITLRSLEYTLRSLDLSAGGQLLEDVAASYLDLKPYDDVLECLGRLAAYQRVILSNAALRCCRRLPPNPGSIRRSTISSASMRNAPSNQPRPPICVLKKSLASRAGKWLSYRPTDLIFAARRASASPSSAWRAPSQTVLGYR
ncbi:(S)-2-haloacid dehalogenase [Ditylenchus destructor]|uniref:(S)-2-haloacid dehalogenase n=1 Tax=Ditylenchus destructor TaxID=166010 RepID=A0AAD4MFK4_9BILA|nr:(S)-2-haloacid dehalogenase [Ditylenchus destructor]